jgi:choline dehydrogenase-like flavoprotein
VAGEQALNSSIVVIGAGPAGWSAARAFARNHPVHLIEGGPIVEPPPSSDVFEALARYGRTDLLAHRTETQTAKPYAAAGGVGGSALVNGMLRMLPDAGVLAEAWDLPGWDEQRIHQSLARTSHGAVQEVGSLERSRLDHVIDELDGSTDTDYFGEGNQRPSWPAGPNVVVTTNARVDRVLTTNDKVVGVVMASGEVLEASSVVLCAGAIETPRLLWRSGLTHAAIGRNLADHPSLAFTVPGSFSTRRATRLAFMSSKPNGANDLLVTSYDRNELVLLTLLRTKSRGWLTAGMIHLNQLSHPDDRAALSSGVRQLASHLPKATGPDGASLEHISHFSDDDLDGWMLQNEDGTYHVAGTCRMGNSAQENVADPKGQVYGVSGLFIADASIFPSLPLATPQATVMAVADAVASGLVASGRVASGTGR